jgi:hypothetical protein
VKTFALLLACSLIAPAFAVVSRGARREHWPTVAAAFGVLAIVLGAIHYLT